MLATIPTTPTHRNPADLGAVAAVRCRASSPGALTVDGLSLADQFAGLRSLALASSRSRPDR
jgi:hypothetical protein